MSKNVSNIIRLIKEEIDISDYTNEDLIDVFLTVFKNWVKEKHGDDIIKYPVSYLLNKYEDDFLKELGLNKKDFSGSTSYRLSRIGRELVTRAMFAYESVPKTDKSWFDIPVNKRIWDTMISRLDIPPYMTVDVNELRPRYLKVAISADFVEMVKSKIPLKYKTVDSLTGEIERFLKEYGGVQLGNPSHGKLQIVDGYYTMDGFYEWEKKELPLLKKELRSVAKNVKSIKYEWDNYYGPTLKVTYNNRRGLGWTERYEDVKKMEEVLRSKGYFENIRVKD